MHAYLETDYIVILYDKVNHMLVAINKRPPSSSGELRENANILIDAMERFKTGKVVYDITYLGPISTDDQQWLATEWYERASRSGYSHCACVIPLSDVFAQVSIENMAYKVPDINPFACFDNIEEAIDWIKQF